MNSETVERPWGTYTTLGQWSDRITLKVLKVNPESRTSLQKHEHRDEEWTCLSGRAVVTVGKKIIALRVGEKIYIPRKKLHRVFSAKGAEILEVSYGKFDEGDVVRVEDDYGRARQAPVHSS
jgi:mannose-6-phosphate isomerase-like protein (cupin superfamily)